MIDSLVVTVEVDGTSLDAGTAHLSRRRSLATSFRYHEDYLRRKDAYAIDPSMGLFAGVHPTSGLPGAFADCSPDRWGRNLVVKKLQSLALQEGRTPPSIDEVDFLIGVSDLTRQGALRFRTSHDGPYLAADPSIPKLVELPRLLRAAEHVTRDGDDDLAAIEELLDAGSGSLGGARPKASVRDGDRLLIAKFPHRSDQWDVMAWEKTALDLARRCGIDVPGNDLLTIDGRNVLVLDRFDRHRSARIGYISAMTLVDGRDGESRDYTEVAETLTEHGAQTSTDLRQLWRRIAFSILIHNTDDHLRNHGFLRDGPGGWRLSPAFDVNPNPDTTEQRVTSVGGARHRADELAGLFAYAGTFDLTEDQARTVLSEVSEAVREWRAVATMNGIGEREQRRFEAAFEGLRDEVHEVSARDNTAPTRQPRRPRGASDGGRFASRSPRGSA